MTRAWIVSMGLVICSLAGLAAQKIQIESQKDDRTDFSKLRTYVWLSSPPLPSHVAPGVPTDARLSQEALGPTVVRAIDRELAARGLKKMEGGESDVNVVYYLALTTGVSSSQLGSYYQYTTGWAVVPLGAGPSTSFEILERGSLIVDVIDRQSKMAIWRGSARTNVNHENTQEKRIARLNDAIRRMFERFPLRAGR